MAGGTVARLRDGFPTLIDLTGAGVTFWEKTVQPPGIDGGEPVDTTTMRNIAVRTKWPRVLYDTDPINLDVAYDPTVYTTIMGAINQNQKITITFPDGGTVAIWGYLRKFTPEKNEEGKEPMAAIIIQPTNMDNSKVEQVPVVAAKSGTGG